MDAQAYLIRHGWSGPGNPLNPNRRPGAHSGLGLTRPLLISRRENKLGIGQKSTKDPTNQWWLRGFEEALRGVGQDGTATPGEDGSDGNCLTRNGSELYKFFVRGEIIPGTLNKKKDSASSTAYFAVNELSKDMRKKEKKAKKEKKEKKTDEKKADKKKRKRDQGDDGAKSDDDHKRKEEKKKRRKLKEAESEAINSEKKSSRQSKKSKTEESPNSTKLSNSDSPDQQNIDKKKRKEKKEKKKRKDISAEDEYPTPDSSTNEESIRTAKTAKDKKPKDETKKSKGEKKERKSKRTKNSKEPVELNE